MRLYVTSDWHLEEQPLWTFPAEMPDFDVAVIAGDLERGIVAAIRQIRSAPALKDKPVVFVPGNHDFDEAVFQDVIAEGLAFAAEYPNIHVLHRRSITIAGVRFVGATLWTDYALYGPARTKPSMVWAGQMMRDHEVIKYREDTGHISRFMPWHTRAEHKRDRAFIEETLAIPYDGPTVVVTHHLPSPRSISTMFQGNPLSPAFASNLDALIEARQPDLWIHGHAHASQDYRIGRTRILANPKGYGPYRNRARTENPSFNHKLVVEVPDRQGRSAFDG